MGKLWRWLKSLFGFDNTPKNPAKVNDDARRKMRGQFPPDVPPIP